MVPLRKDALLGPDRFARIIQGGLTEQPVVPYHFLIGSGFSYTAGIPTARGITAILAHKKMFGVQDMSQILSAYFKNEIDEDKVLEAYRKRCGDLRQYGELYKRFFADQELFPRHAVSRREFIDGLITFANDQSFGYNFESLYLAFLCNASRYGRFKIDTILTTNFDDVVSTGFSKLGAPHRVLDHARAILSEDVSTKYPRIVHLHGRYLHYDLVNTDAEIDSTIEGAVSNGQSVRGQAIRRIITRLPAESALIVIGYSGWDDAVMGVLKEAVQDGKFSSGIFWCHFGGDITEGLATFSNTTPQLSVVNGLSALDAMRILVEAAGIPETAIIERVRAAYNTTRRNFEARWVGIEQNLLLRGLPDSLAQGKSSGMLEIDSKPPTVEEALSKARRALSQSSLARVAFSIIEAVIRDRCDLEPEQQALLYQARAELRRRYSQRLDGAVIDFHWAIRLKTPHLLEAKIGLADTYIRLQHLDVAKPILRQARELAEQEGDRLTLARCDVLQAILLFFSTHLEEALSLLTSAAQVFSEAEDLDWLARCRVNAGYINVFASRLDEASSCALSVPSQIKYWKGASELLQGQILLDKNQISEARARLESALALAEEGPQFTLLGHISHFLAECCVREGEMKKALEYEEDAYQYYGLAGQSHDQANARAWSMIHRTLMRDDPGSHFEDILGGTLEELDRFRDAAISALAWVLLALSCMLGHFSQMTRSLCRRAIDRCSYFVSQLEANLGSSGEDGVDMRPLVERKQYLLLASLLWQLQHSPEEQAVILADYREFQKLAGRYGVATPRLKTIHAVIAYLLVHRGIAQPEMLYPLDGPRGGIDFSSQAICAFCDSQKYRIYSAVVCSQPSA